MPKIFLSYWFLYIPPLIQKNSTQKNIPIEVRTLPNMPDTGCRTFLRMALFVSVTISRSSFIPTTVWNMSKGVEPWSRSISTSTSKVNSFFVIGFSLSSHFHSSIVLFFFFFLSSHCGTLPFLWFALFSSDGALTFFFFVVSLIIELWFHFLVFLGREL